LVCEYEYGPTAPAQDRKIKPTNMYEMSKRKCFHSSNMEEICEADFKNDHDDQGDQKENLGPVK
jgi:hypothetical protein